MTITTTTTADDLRGRIILIDDRRVELSAELEELSYLSLVERDARATKRLREITQELGHLDTEKLTLNGALAGIGRREAEAKAVERDETERDRAGKALALLDSFAKRGAALDVAFGEAIGEYNALAAEFRELEKLGHSPTTFPLVKITMKYAAPVAGNDAAAVEPLPLVGAGRCSLK
jgi:hypothetical protein